MTAYLKNRKKGFTLVELIVVIVIIAVLAAVLVVSLTGYIGKAQAATATSTARQVYMASSSGLTEWKAAGSPGNGDKAYKINIEKNIIELIGIEGMKSFTESNSTEDSVQVALSMPSYYSQGWATFVRECEAGNYRNFARVWVGKNPDKTVGDSVKGIYYVSQDGKTAVRIVYDELTKLGSADQRAGVYYERIG